MELTGPQLSASAGVLPRAMAAVKVEEKESPAPVRSTGGAGSGYVSAVRGGGGPVRDHRRYSVSAPRRSLQFR